jgi:hypothetical protein
MNPQKIAPGAEALACVRPEFIRVAGAGCGNGNVFRGKVETLLFIGRRTRGRSGSATRW